MLVVSQYNNVQLSAPSNQSLSTRILVTKQHGASRGFSETAVAVFDKRNACTTPNAQSRNLSTTYSTTQPARAYTPAISAAEKHHHLIH